MKISDFAKKQGVSYKTAWRWFRDNQIPGVKMPSGTIIISEDSSLKPEKYVVYARVSSPTKKDDLLRQAQEVEQAVIASGKFVGVIVVEIASTIFPEAITACSTSCSCLRRSSFLV